MPTPTTASAPAIYPPSRPRIVQHPSGSSAPGTGSPSSSPESAFLLQRTSSASEERPSLNLKGSTRSTTIDIDHKYDDAHSDAASDASDDAGDFYYARPGPSTPPIRRWWGALPPLTLLPAFFLGILCVNLFPRVLTFSQIALTSTLMSSLDPPSNRANYTHHDNGHLYLNLGAIETNGDSSHSPYGAYQGGNADKIYRHPIHDLITNATKEWESKLARQSKTLKQAVAEYKRRYKRNPPKGFDKWFAFAKSNGVILIDEFDNTVRDVEPFWGLSPKIIDQRAAELRQDPTTFTMYIKNGNISIIGSHRGDGRAKDQVGLLKNWAQYIDELNITMSAHDGPSIMMDHPTRQRHLDAARSGETIPDDEADSLDDDPSYWGFPLACPPESRLRRLYNGLEGDKTLPPGPSYVYDHTRTMDLCRNPEWQYLHGFTAWAGMRPKLLQPLFSFAKTDLHSDLLLTPLEQYWDYEPWDPEWDKKPYNKAVWRGSTTGVWFDRTTWWRSSQRVRLYFMSKDNEGGRFVVFNEPADSVQEDTETERLILRNVSTTKLMDRYVDFAFSGHMTQCTEKDGSCDAVKDIIEFAPLMGWNQANDYKYLLDLDGNAWSGRFHRLLSSNSVILKSTIFPEWYSTWIQPWVHYVPIKIDYSDLFDVMAFFSGDMDGKHAHEDLAKTIAANGREFANKYWRFADMEAYVFRLALEWARCTSFDRPSMDYEYDEKHEV